MLQGDDLVEFASLEPTDERDALSALLLIQELHTASLDQLQGAERFQHHPFVARLKGQLEGPFLDQLNAFPRVQDADSEEGAVPAMRRIAAIDLVPPVYDWLAEQATWPQLIEFLSVEGGPDGGFDDLVALCQVGIDGQAKVTLAANYWDEMGRGSLEKVHTELHRALSRSLALPQPSIDQLPTEALARAALNGLLATNRALQPEMIGALGLLELQAGPRCRKVLQALHRLDAPAAAFPFYEEHATADPRHGKEWIDHAVGALAAQHPHWAHRIVRGAAWRSAVNEALFTCLHTHATHSRAA